LKSSEALHFFFPPPPHLSPSLPVPFPRTVPLANVVPVLVIWISFPLFNPPRFPNRKSSFWTFFSIRRVFPIPSRRSFALLEDFDPLSFQFPWSTSLLFFILVSTPVFRRFICSGSAISFLVCFSEVPAPVSIVYNLFSSLVWSEFDLAWPSFIRLKRVLRSHYSVAFTVPLRAALGIPPSSLVCFALLSPCARVV